MKIIVSIKRVVDHNVQVRPSSDHSAVELAGARMSINPFDENALEEAVRLKERGIASEVIVVSFGDSGVQESLRQALALGATRAIWGQLPAGLEQPDQLAVAKLLREVVQAEQASLVLLGKQAIDEDAGQTAQMLAALLDWPQATAVSALEIEGEKLKLQREVEGGTESLEVQLPAVLSADLRLNAPRFAKLPDLMKAKRLPIEPFDCAAAGLALGPRLRTLRVESPAPRAGGIVVSSVAELVEKLRHEAQVIA
ncbi:electron transfer flavoprotein subunit beta/FixA family protein [Uliginosibacterium aquaticum]|uniref:Electron transfer flavoprotein subunit beta n=1 Tax=Uliginosibacterium aquaticum TaxID=2731212 RepID=A0ABX2IIT3_9RHOO|nr:electron transfer flavoprotein subunit beta/FixA family protein [Uliginosibacterium aquaticum]NSL53950.1 electron transfer flavoprotein subunit beta/FixA family protein [Uliginosibacterium aquaticum]